MRKKTCRSRVEIYASGIAGGTRLEGSGETLQDDQYNGRPSGCPSAGLYHRGGQAAGWRVLQKKTLILRFG
ncbi:hypothetical protein PQR62_19475 [Herbaspirillum lusitanum]|jgi:hypothetical protein|uniref:Uncharacterized protein n=1 Tax=Herbaspirillum lusitanum TaxID=213312 RepID=A0ABW9AEZ3_9BURK